MIVACFNHISFIEFSEFGEKKMVHFGLFLMRLSPLAGQQKGEIKFILQKYVYLTDGKGILNFLKNRYIT